jgi:hypothetical protein
MGTRADGPTPKHGRADASRDRRLVAIDRRLGDWVVFFLVVLALWLWFAPLVPEWSGYGWLARLLGGDAAVTRFFLAFLFIYFAGIVREKNALRHTVHGMVSLIRSHLGARDPAQLQDAVDILIHALAEVAEPATRERVLERLRRMTRQDLGSDPAAWRAWWDAKRDGFPPPGGGDGELD